jgi:hypothetical protein
MTFTGVVDHIGGAIFASGASVFSTVARAPVRLRRSDAPDACNSCGREMRDECLIYVPIGDHCARVQFEKALYGVFNQNPRDGSFAR